MRCLDEVGDAFLALWSTARRELLDQLQHSGMFEDYFLDQTHGRAEPPTICMSKRTRTLADLWSTRVLDNLELVSLVDRSLMLNLNQISYSHFSNHVSKTCLCAW